MDNVGTIILVPHLLVNWLQLVWRSGTRRWNLQVPDLQMSCSDLTRMKGCQDNSYNYPAASWLPIPLSHIGSQVKRRQSQSYKFKKLAKISNFFILKRALHATYLLKLLDKMCKYEMDPMSIVENTERTRFCPQTDKVIPVYPPFNFVEAGGITIAARHLPCLGSVSPPRHAWVDLLERSS